MHKPSSTLRIKTAERGSGTSAIPVTRNASGCVVSNVVQLDMPGRSAAGTDRSVRGLMSQSNAVFRRSGGATISQYRVCA
jgi:hypothetical protein